ncbi:nascent polypeptide-associated complex subunit alpha, muscle-specific form [Toxorhynchites rutilus septentrionalis]|uniref:nascent polypeptide-associated complex subunit alpha, muscle-specific form n=1 Tax=Toxorhynchites rutilus septentrionalis TaxID=329112 RepID=UPI0024797E91|nr:nascent polypeptide-associated complex subunit alpha, muscle-specific form [Toxorhynchites rutilus septentrionalis]
MSQEYTHQLLKVVVAQICQTIGWHSIQSTPLELLVDILDQYLKDITRLTHRYSELYNRTEPNLDDVALAYREVGLNLSEVGEYVQFVDPIEPMFEVPKYPIPKVTHLNFMKPGSKEVLTRPVHIPEYMPPMLVDLEEEQEDVNRQLLQQQQQQQHHLEHRHYNHHQQQSQALLEDDVLREVKPEFGDFVEKMEEVGAEEVALMDTNANEEVVTFKKPLDVGAEGGSLDVKKARNLTEEGRPTREISSVIMTTSGFISPAREGKLPDSKCPVIPEERPKPPPPPPPPAISAMPVSRMDEKFGKKTKRKPAEKEKKREKKVDKKKDSGEKDTPSRPPTPVAALPVAEPPVSSVIEDIKPLPVAFEPPPKPPTPVPDVKPPEPLLPPIELEKPVVPPLPIAPPMEKPKKEKTRKKKQQTPKKSAIPPPMLMSPGAGDIGGLFSPHQLPQPPSQMHQITPPKPPKPKRQKLTKKDIQRQYMEQLQQFQSSPLNAQNIIDMFTPNKKPLPGLFQPSLFSPPPQQQQALPPQPKFPDSPAQSQLDLLQKLHPSLEITPAPGPSGGGGPPMHSPSPDKHKLNIFKKVAKKDTTSPGITTQGPIIVIDDDKSPPHQPQFLTTTPMGNKKRPPKGQQSNSVFAYQDAVSSSELSFNMGMNSVDHSGTGAGGLFREFSPPKTPSNLPKTPDIKLQSSSSSSTSWMSDSGKLPAVGLGQIFGDFPNFNLPPAKEEKKKRQRQRQPKETASKKANKNAQIMDDLSLLQQIQQHQQQQSMPVGSAPSMDDKSFPKAMASYSKLLNQTMPQSFLSSQIRNPMFGMFPLPSGPGLIPDNPLFNPFPGQPSFLPTGPFGMPSMPPRFDIGNLLRYPRPPKAPVAESFENLDPETKLAHTPLDLQKSNCNVAPLMPPSLQIDSVGGSPSPTSGRKQQSPAIGAVIKDQSPLNHQPVVPPQEQSLNLCTKSVTAAPSRVPPQNAHQSASPGMAPLLPEFRHQTLDIRQEPLRPSAPATPSSAPPLIPPQTGLTTGMAPETQPMHHLLAAAAPNVPPITPGETIVIGSDSDSNSESTTTAVTTMIGGTTGGPMDPTTTTGGGPGLGKKSDKSEKRKNREHKKDKKLKEGKIKKKKDKKDKNKSKDRDRERPKSSHSMHPDGMETNSDVGSHGGASAAADEAALMDQIRRKEKKEKKKEKLKKEKRKEKERAAAAALDLGPFNFGFGDPHTSSNGGGSAVTTSNNTVTGSDQRDNSDGSSASVPKLMLRLGSNATPSPRSGTPDIVPVVSSPAETAASRIEPVEIKREASPELARISALVTRPPKLKTPSTKGKSKEEDGTKLPKSTDHPGKTSGKLDFSAEQSSKPRPRGIQPLPDSIDLFSVNPTTSNPPSVSQPKPSPLAGPAANVTAASAPAATNPDSTPHSSKKPPKEPKSSKSHGSVTSSLGVTIPAPLNTPSNVKDAEGNVVWICPACGRVDDGTPMIGCDGCDAWYHWVCVGIQVPPDSNEDWYCRVCIGKKQEPHGDEKQKKRKKKDKKNPRD